MRTLSQSLVLIVAVLGPAAGASVVDSGEEPIGFGTSTRGGADGRMIRVTTLKADGPGSLREALGAKGPRTVVFDVGGVIDLGGRSLQIDEPFVTVDGASAPPPGITVIKGSLYISTHDVVVRHLRVRPGDAGRAKRSGWEPDGISTAAAYNVVIDHCSLTWAVDENLSVSGPRHEGPEGTSHDIRLSHCIIAEGLDDSSHGKGPHSKGTLIHDHCRKIAVIGNLYAHNVRRNPMFKPDVTAAVINNVIYNPGSAAMNFSWPVSEYVGRLETMHEARVAVVGNVFRYGRDTRGGMPLISGRGKAYLRDNIAVDRKGKAVPIRSDSVKELSEPPLWPEGLEALPADQVLEAVLEDAGARPWDRDAIDERIVRQTRAGEGRIIDSQEQAGGYPR